MRTDSDAAKLKTRSNLGWGHHVPCPEELEERRPAPGIGVDDDVQFLRRRVEGCPESRRR